MDVWWILQLENSKYKSRKIIINQQKWVRSEFIERVFFFCCCFVHHGLVSVLELDLFKRPTASSEEWLKKKKLNWTNWKGQSWVWIYQAVYQAHACLRFRNVNTWPFIILLHFACALWQPILSEIYIQVCTLTWEVPRFAHWWRASTQKQLSINCPSNIECRDSRPTKLFKLSTALCIWYKRKKTPVDIMSIPVLHNVNFYHFNLIHSIIKWYDFQ